VPISSSGDTPGSGSIPLELTHRKETTKVQTIKLGNLEFDVSADGAIRQQQSVTPTLLDEVRLAASSAFLSNPRALTKAQHEYWAAVRAVTPEHKRFTGGR
jgi:hypothetical protein